jgi:hypothetical protein
VVGDLRLGQVKPANQLADAELAIGSEQLEDPQSDRVAQASEVLRHELGRERRGRQPEG